MSSPIGAHAPDIVHVTTTDNTHPLKWIIQRKAQISMIFSTTTPGDNLFTSTFWKVVGVFLGLLVPSGWYAHAHNIQMRSQSQTNHHFVHFGFRASL